MGNHIRLKLVAVLGRAQSCRSVVVEVRPNFRNRAAAVEVSSAPSAERNVLGSFGSSVGRRWQRHSPVRLKPPEQPNRWSTKLLPPGAES